MLSGSPRPSLVSLVVLGALLTSPLAAQVGRTTGASTLSSVSVKSVTVAPGATVLTNITVDAGAEGEDTIDAVVSDSAVVVSLVLPNGTEVTAANAASLGFTFTTYSVPGADDDDLPNPLASAGTHVTMEFPAAVTSRPPPSISTWCPELSSPKFGSRVCEMLICLSR